MEMSSRKNQAQERRSPRAGVGGSGSGPGSLTQATDATRSDASARIDAKGRLRHPCAHQGCGSEGCYGQGGNILRAYAEAAAGRDASRWLGQWWCRAHVPEGFFPNPIPSGAAAEKPARADDGPRRQVIEGQGVLL